MKTRKRAHKMGDGLSLNSDPNVLKIKDKIKVQTSYAVEYKVPEFDISGNGNWGKVGDGLELSSGGSTRTAYTTPEQAYGSTGSGSYSTAPSGSGTDSQIEEGNSALGSGQVAVVEAAKRGVDTLVSSPEAAESVVAANGAVDGAQGAVSTGEQGVVSATGEQEEAKGVEKGAEADKKGKTEQVTNQKADLKAKEGSLKKAEAAEVKAKGEVTAAEATVASAKATVAEAKAAVAAASAAIPFSAPAVAAAKAALAAAEAALKAAEAKLAAAKAQLEKATAEKEVATAERDKSKAQLEKDETALEKAEKALEAAKEKVTQADEKLNTAKEALQTAQADLAEKTKAYEAVKGQVKEQSSSLSKKLDDTLKQLKEGKDSKENASNGSNVLQKGQAAMNMFNQGAGALSALTGAAQGSGDTASSKRKMTAQEKANIYAFTNNLEKSLNNGFGQITYNGQMLSDVKTAATNPFLKKTV